MGGLVGGGDILAGRERGGGNAELAFGQQV